MSLYIETEGTICFSFDIEEVARLVIDAALDIVQCPYEAESNLLLTHDDEIHERNREHRGIARPTDVLSFPMLEFAVPGDFTEISEDAEDIFNPESGELMLGDIVISVDRVLTQAEEYGHSSRREYAFLIAHSMLHLCGYDHMEEDERALMEEKQREIMEKINILR